MTTPSMMQEQDPPSAAKEVLRFWFDPETVSKHYIKDPAFDALIKTRFLETYDKAHGGASHAWQKTPQGLLALVIVLDQFPRNMFRNTPQAFATDKMALSLAKEGIYKRFSADLAPEQRAFLYLPLMHSEALPDQEVCVDLFEQLGNDEGLHYAKLHRDIIARFGRFPHRNLILGRISTQDELDFLKTENSSF